MTPELARKAYEHDTIIVCVVTRSTQAEMIASFAELAEAGGRQRRVIGIDASAIETIRMTGKRLGQNPQPADRIRLRLRDQYQR